MILKKKRKLDMKLHNFAKTVNLQSFLALCTLFSTTSGSDHGPIVNAPNGAIMGKYIQLPDDELVSAFLGVPYAQPPIGHLRFREPLTVKPYSKVMNATEFGPLCPQEGEFQVVDIESNTFRTKKNLHLAIKSVSEYPVDEDCLTLNIYTPTEENIKKIGNLLPVLFYIHGGSYFTNGGRLYPGQKLSSNGIVVITINYRLGPLGFLSTEDEASSGNYGMLDQIAALKWVHKNIQVFGGDKSKITLFGNSAGGSSVGFHLLSPLSKGLFNSAISQSGSPLASWAFQRKPHEKAMKLAKKVECDEENNNLGVIECLRSVPVDVIIKNSEIGQGFDLSFAPSIDAIRGSNAFLPTSPRDILKNKAVNEVPFMMGITTDEITLWFQNVTEPMTDLEFDVLVRMYTYHLVDEINTSEEIVNGAIITQLVMLEYNHLRSNKSDDFRENIKLAASMMSDMELKAPSLKFAEEYGRRSKYPVYFYEFGYRSADDLRSKSKPWMGAYHESELQFLFGLPYLQLNNSLSLESDKKTSDLMMSLWTNFARYKNPTATNENNISWEAFQPNGHKYFLYINESGTNLRENFQTRKMSFWNSFVPLLTSEPITSEQIVGSLSKTDMCNYKIAFYILLCISFILLIIVIMISALNARQRKALKLCRAGSVTTSPPSITTA